MPQFVRDELAGWQEMAAMWPLRFCAEDPQARCEACDQGVIRLIDDKGQGYLYSRAEVVALVVAHIRQVHGDQRAGGLSAFIRGPCRSHGGLARLLL
jgi:hypothetical protein